MADTKTAAEVAFDAYIESYALKYEKAAACLATDRDALLAFYDFPATLLWLYSQPSLGRRHVSV